MSQTNESLRVQQIKKLLDTFKESGNKRTETISYRGQQKTIEVIRINPTVLVLNHNNSRLTSQLSDHPKSEICIKDPSSEKAQEILAEILSKTEKFQSLKEELKSLKQQQVGLISRQGLLINGNTRAVALRQLGVEGMDVAVLPEDADEEVFLDLEMQLQMTRLTHQDYTFTNELLLLEKYRKICGDEQLAAKMNWRRNGKKKVKLHLLYLHLVNEIREFSDPKIQYVEFDSKRTHIMDLVQEYESLKDTPKEAEKMKWTRIAAMFLGVNKDQVRQIDSEFIDEDIVKQIEPDSDEGELLKGLQKFETDDDLNDILGEKTDSEVVDPRLLAKKVITDLTDQDGLISKDLTPGLEGIHDAMRRASERIINKQKDDQFKKTPLLKLKDARELIEGVVNSYNEVKLYHDFDKGKFEYSIKKLRETLDDLTKEVKLTKHIMNSRNE